MADDNWSVRRNTAEALGEVGAAAAAAIPALVDALDEYREDEGVGRAARHALEEIGLSAVPALLEVLRRGDLEGEERPERWHNATIVLRDMGPTVVPLLLGGLSGNDNEADGVAMVLTMLDPPARVAIPQLIACLQPSRSALVRAQVAAALSKMAPLPIEAVGPLAAALEEPWSRASAARALGSMGSAAASALPALERALQSARGEQGIATDEQVILEAIGKIRQERVPIR